MFSSSLPQFPDGFRAYTLDHLELHCKEDNGECLGVGASVTPAAIERFPILFSLVIDGRNYYNNCRKGFWQTAQFSNLNDLTIANYTPLPGESFTSSDCLLPIPLMDEVKILIIDNVALVPSPSPLPTISRPHCPVELVFIDIHTFEPIIEILRALEDTSELMITRCAIGDPRIPFGGEWGVLTLDGIDADQNLVALLRRWQGKSLKIIDCPGFDDAVLLDMMTSNDAEDMCAARNLYSLDIEDCDNFSGASLRRFVHARRLMGYGISKVNVFGRAPEISDEDEQWLLGALNRFSYEPSLPASGLSSPI
jgi:hypothetical protein